MTGQIFSFYPLAFDNISLQTRRLRIFQTHKATTSFNFYKRNLQMTSQICMTFHATTAMTCLSQVKIGHCLPNLIHHLSRIGRKNNIISPAFSAIFKAGQIFPVHTSLISVILQFCLFFYTNLRQHTARR